MNFTKSHLYHVYNQGNNRQRIFFKEENYHFFLKKVKTHVAPFADILAWCLMPNHFHLMVRVNEVELPITSEDTHPMIQSQVATLTDGVTLSHPVSSPAKQRTLNNSIGILLRSYTRAINKSLDRSGCLFREETKAECLDNPQGITPSFYNTRSGTSIPIDNPEKEYPQICFNYIHQNPVKAKLVMKPEDWAYSSYRDIVGLRNGTLINRERIKELELVIFNYSSDDLESSDE
ncbi:MAG: hypothetical protein WCX31_19370 [Salinivirgaceae bacterium]|jgi:putative transposase